MSLGCVNVKNAVEKLRLVTAMLGVGEAVDIALSQDLDRLYLGLSTS